jgi:uncharacterized protein YjbI with pentapeptide repeats
LAAVILLAWIVVVIVVALLVGGAWWAMGTPYPVFPTDLEPKSLDAIATRAFAVVAGFGGAALLVINYRRQRTTEAEDTRAELAAAREETRLFTERFDTASNKLGSEHAAIRLAGVHALAHLADDAPRGRDDLIQMCIDVLCAYLRMPYRPEPDDPGQDAMAEQQEAYRTEKLSFASMREVRHTIIGVIGDRLRSESRWRGRAFDFTGTVFDGGDLADVDFSGCWISFASAEFRSGNFLFSGARFAGGQAFFDGTIFSGGRVHFDASIFAGDVSFEFSVFIGANVSFLEAECTDGWVTFDAARFVRGVISFDRFRLTGGQLSFTSTRFSGSRVTFHLAEFDGKGKPNFVGAEFIGGQVEFTDRRWGFHCKGRRPVGLEDAVANGQPDVVLIPDDWQAAPEADNVGDQPGTRHL